MSHLRVFALVSRVCSSRLSPKEVTGILLCVDSVSEAAPVLGVNLSKIYLNKCLLLFLIKWAALLNVIL